MELAHKYELKYKKNKRHQSIKNKNIKLHSMKKQTTKINKKNIT